MLKENDKTLALTLLFCYNMVGNLNITFWIDMNPFDYVTAINDNKLPLIVDDVTEKGYNPFMTNRSLSYFSDTVAVANAMNQYHYLDHKLQFDFLINIVRKRKRFSKWIKPESVTDLEAVKEYYGYSNEKAKQAMSLLSTDQLTAINKRIYKGGRK
tara:strand:- start:72 stop:539 length:468 start_codon:yes stop_codon:yes gene_type:complete